MPNPTPPSEPVREMKRFLRYVLPLLLPPFLIGVAGRELPAPAQVDPDVATYWRSPAELWVYDTRPEVGVGTHALDSRSVSQLRDLRVRLVRHTLYWNQVENTPTPGRYDPAVLADWDERVRRAEEAGLELVVVVHGNPPGLGYGNREEAYRRFARFMGDMAERYPGIRFWELWNEMDQGFTDLFGAGRPEVGMRERGRMYAQMLRLAYPEIKRANPAAWVLTGGMVDPVEFPSGIYEGGGGDYFDIMNLHTYGQPVVQSFVGRGEMIDSVMRAHGDEGRPLWNTEFGIDAGAMVTAWGFPHAVPGEDDGRVFDGWHLQNWREPLEANRERRIYQKAIGYQLHAGNETLPERLRSEAKLPRGQTPDDYGFGLVRSDGRTPRPAYRWLRGSGLNDEVLGAPRRTVDVEVEDRPGFVPVGHEHHLDPRTGSRVIRGVEVGTLEPTVVRFAPAP